MKTICIFLCVFTGVLPIAGLYAQNYEIDFTGTGETTVVDSVTVENLNLGITLTLGGNDVLQLKITTGIAQDASCFELLQVFPNPMTGKAEIRFPVHERGNATVAVYDLSGKSVAQSTMFLQPGIHTYGVSGLTQGIYMVRIQERDATYSSRLVCGKSFGGEAKIAYVSSDALQSDVIATGKKQLKSASSAIEMPYNAGERLKFTGMSGNFGTVLTNVPDGSGTITFDFMDCTDADGNHYPVITVDTQTFMAENLETTRYNDGTNIPLVRDDEAWTNLSTSAYCWYNNDSIAYKDIFGALYNWFAVDTATNGGKNVCPTGWHVPSDDEWTILADYLGGENVAGGKLKETGTTYWDNPNTGATNETGFTIRGTGWRYSNGIFNDIGKYNCIWSSTANDASQAFYRELDWNQRYFLRYPWYKKCGFSVRCVKE